MPKVLRIINRFNLGGPTYNAANLTHGLSPEFETLLIGGPHEPGETSSTFICDQLGLSYQILPEMQRAVSYQTDKQAFRKIQEIIWEFKPDIVHTHASKAGALGRWAAHKCNVPVIVHTFHGHVFQGYFGKGKTYMYKSVERLLSRWSSSIIAISAHQKKELTEIHKVAPAHKTKVIPLGFDLSRFLNSGAEQVRSFRSRHGLAEDTFVVGIIGRLAPIKDHDLFLNAIAIATKKASRKIQAVIVGDGELRERLQSKADDLGLSNITWTSWITDVESAIPGMDVVVLTSINEGTPVSLIEAQACGVPVISTDVGGVRDILLNGKTGLMIGSRSPEDIAEAILTLETSDSKLRKMGEAGRKWVEHRYSAKRLTEDMRLHYHDLLQNK